MSDDLPVHAAKFKNSRIYCSVGKKKQEDKKNIESTL